MAYFMYVSLQRDDKIAIFEMDPASGKLQAQGSVAVDRPAPWPSTQRGNCYLPDEEIRKISGYLALE